MDSYTGAVNNPLNVLLADLDPIWKNCGEKAILYDEHGIMIAAHGYGDHWLLLNRHCEEQIVHGRKTLRTTKQSLSLLAVCVDSR